MKRKIAIYLSLLAFGQVATAADLFVSPGGAGLDCLEASPCASIQQAVDISSPGDQINVAAGTYFENVSIGGPANPNAKPGITITGKGDKKTHVVSAGGKGMRPAGVLADIVFDVWSADVTIEKLSIEHPEAVATKRDIGVFVGPPAVNATLSKCTVVRNRLGPDLEPTAPGSRGILVFRAGGSVVTRNHFEGNYEDHIHMPTHDTEITRNEVEDATRLGIVIVQETPDSNSTGSIIAKNEVEGSGGDGIQIQGDNNIVVDNEVEDSGGAGIKLCGIDEVGDCINPFDAWSEASGNTVSNNELEDNAAGIIDNGSGNTVTNNELEDEDEDDDDDH